MLYMYNNIVSDWILADQMDPAMQKDTRSAVPK
jgi:hypothetical protein